MIVRETTDAFILIEQAHHATIAGHMAKHLLPAFSAEDERWHSVLHAIENHDIGWHPFDDQPFYNDEKSAPYTFLDFPTAAKSVLYRHGIDEVAQSDTYAALLCSLHYLRFMENNTHEAAKEFVYQEHKRQKKTD
ncbi:DUF3891 family protein [Virgibacillus halophilus]|uniref:DUF3891 family protein n=1 Tax=Tigheibacillus halophilus TaxID=361280 RepID=A0ABU5C765_9BACI|nr:DUF3891 family protein [Virgibacillus halophilus]